MSSSARPAARRFTWPIVILIAALMLAPVGLASEPIARAAALATSADVRSAVEAAPMPAWSSTAAPSTWAQEFTGVRAGADAPASTAPASAFADQWLSSLQQAEKLRGSSLVSLPDLGLLSRARDAAGPVEPAIQLEPGPMGLTDYGLGASGPYAYNTSHFLGELTFASAPNATATGGYSNVNPVAGSSGAVGSIYGFSVQLNTVLGGVVIPDSSAGVFWTQNVFDFNDTSLKFVDDVFNLSNSDLALYPGTIYSGGGVLYGTEAYQNIGPVIPITGYPLSISLYNNATVIDGRSAATFAFVIAEPGHTYAETYDTVVFNNPNAGVGPAPTPPLFTVDGFEPSPSGVLLDDAELDIGGLIGGDNSVFSALDASLALEYANDSAGPWLPIPSAYDFGSDTGETSAGVAAVWNAATHTESLSAGPSLLYGFWNTPSNVSVPSGAIEYQGTISPSFAFLFVGNSPQNLTLLPTTAAGAFQTYLPPTGSYAVQAFADGYAEFNGSSFSANTTGVAIALTSSPGTLDAPLEVNGAAQAAALELAVTGSSGVPYTFADLTVDINFTFNHLNDYGFPSFILFQSKGVAAAFDLSNLTQGPSGSNGSTEYLMDFGPPGFLTGIVYNTSSLPGYSQQIALYDGLGGTISDETFTGYYGTYILPGFPEYAVAAVQGGVAYAEWTPDLAVTDIDSVDGSYGAYVSSSAEAQLTNLFAEDGSNGADVIASPDATVSNATAIGPFTFGVLDYGSPGGVFEDLFAAGPLAFGFVAGSPAGLPGPPAVPGATGALIENVTTIDFATGVYLTESADTTVLNVSTSESAGAVVVLQSGTTTIENVTANGGWGVDLYGAEDTTVSEETLANESYLLTNYIVDLATESFLEIGGAGAFLEASNNTTFSDLTLFNVSLGFSGLEPGNSTETVFDNTLILESDEGLELGGATLTAFFGLDVEDSDLGVALVQANDTLALNVTAVNTPFGAALVVLYGNDTTASLVTAYDAVGIAALGVDGYSVSSVTAGYGGEPAILGISVANASVTNVSVADGAGVGLMWANGSVVDRLTVTGGGEGLELYDSNGATVQQVVATNGSAGAFIDPSNDTTLSDLSAANGSAAALIEGSNDVNVSSVSVTNLSIGVWAEDSSNLSISGVTATNLTVSTPWALDHAHGTPAVAAIVTQGDSYVLVSGVSATRYPAALYDAGSEDLFAEDVTATDGSYGLVLNQTLFGDFTAVAAAGDFVGIAFNNGSFGNVVTGSAFSDDTSFGVAIFSGADTLVYDNSFVGNNGATSTYSATHIQAFSAPANAFNSPTAVGNYWADWHSYAPNGTLNPYYVSNGVWDYFPLGGRAGTFAVTFTAHGLAPGTSWSVTLGGVESSTAGATITYYEPAGSYAFTTGAVAGYLASPTGGTVSVASGPVGLSIGFSAQYAVTFEQSSLPTGAAWSVVFDGVESTSTAATLVVSASAGPHAYTVVAPAGYAPTTPSGTLTVSGAYLVPLTFYSTAVPTYTVTVSQTGLTGVAWSVVFGGALEQTTTGTLTFVVPAGTYTYQVVGVAGYVAAPSSGTLIVAANYTLAVAFSPVLYPVSVTETGLAAGTSWSATVGGQSLTTVGASITFYLPNGSYPYTVASVSGYSLAGGTGSAKVAGTPTAVAVAFSPNSVPSTVTTSTYTTGFAIALALGVVALVLGAVALLHARRRTPPPAAWTPPAKGGEAGAAAPSGASGSSTYWSEDSPATGGKQK